MAILLPSIAKTQSNWQAGYVISNSNDTIRGLINYGDYNTMSREFEYKESTNSEKKLFYPQSCTDVVFDKGAHFISKMINDSTKIFVEILVDGKLNLYYTKLKRKEYFFIESDTLPLRQLDFGTKPDDDNGKTYDFNNTKYMGILKYYTKDAPNLSNEIKIVKPDINSLKKFTVKYHNEVCPDNSCKVFDGGFPTAFYELGVFVGRMANREFSNSSTSVSLGISYGILMRKAMPRVNKNFFFKTGFVFSKVSLGEGINENLPRIPLLFEYAFPLEVIKPKITFGMNLYSFKALLFCGGLGVDVVLSDKSIFTCTVEKDFFYFFDDISNYPNNIQIGLYYSLNR
jgi:hypothetical protein